MMNDSGLGPLSGASGRAADDDHITERASSPTKPERLNVIVVNENDVLLGRGAPMNNHFGNVQFRELVNKDKERYMQGESRQVKNEIAQHILDEIAKRGGRFLRRTGGAATTEDDSDDDDDTTSNQGVWVVADDATVLEKVKQALRERDTKRRPVVPSPAPVPAVVWNRQLGSADSGLATSGHWPNMQSNRTALQGYNSSPGGQNDALLGDLLPFVTDQGFETVHNMRLEQEIRRLQARRTLNQLMLLQQRREDEQRHIQQQRQQQHLETLAALGLGGAALSPEQERLQLQQQYQRHQSDAASYLQESLARRAAASGSIGQHSFPSTAVWDASTDRRATAATNVASLPRRYGEMSSSAMLTQQATNTTEQLLSDEQLALLLMIQQNKEKRDFEQSRANLAQPFTATGAPSRSESWQNASMPLDPTFSAAAAAQRTAVSMANRQWASTPSLSSRVPFPPHIESVQSTLESRSSVTNNRRKAPPVAETFNTLQPFKKPRL